MYFRNFLILFLIVLIFSCQSQTVDTYQVLKDNRFELNIKSLEHEIPEFFSIDLGEKKISFFVVKIGNSIESYLNACIKCYPHDMGYRYEASHVVCRYCNISYPIDSLKEGVGSCYPVPIEGKLQGDNYIIILNEFEKAKQYF